MKLTLSSESELIALAGKIASITPAGAILYLKGGLGAGKTTFARGFIQSLGTTAKIKSPTYTLIEEYDLPGKHIVHVDLYRLHDADELSYIGFPEEIPENSIMLIEWPERAVAYIPAPDLEISITHSTTGRIIDMTSFSTLGEAILTQKLCIDTSI